MVERLHDADAFSLAFDLTPNARPTTQRAFPVASEEIIEHELGWLQRILAIAMAVGSLLLVLLLMAGPLLFPLLIR